MAGSGTRNEGKVQDRRRILRPIENQVAAGDLHIAHFKPRPPIIRGRKIRHQAILDELMRMADHGIRILGYQPPEPEELRRIMRLYASSARRWREGPYTVQYMMENKTYYQATCYLSTFVMHRLDLEKLSKS